MLTQERLKELLHYDEETGIFTRKEKIGRYLKGSVSGSKHRKGYIQITIDSENYLAHRVAWMYVYGEFPKDQIDHINRIKTDNRRENLRLVNPLINCLNRGPKTNGKSKFKGVAKQGNRWQVCVNGKYIGLFATEIDAAKAYDIHVVKVFGEYATTNKGMELL